MAFAAHREWFSFRVLNRQRSTWKAVVHAMGLITGVDDA